MSNLINFQTTEKVKSFIKKTYGSEGIYEEDYFLDDSYLISFKVNDDVEGIKISFGANFTPNLNYELIIQECLECTPFDWDEHDLNYIISCYEAGDKSCWIED